MKKLIEHRHEGVIRETGDRKSLFHMKTIRVELVLTFCQKDGLLKTLVIDHRLDMVEGITDGFAHFSCESVFVVDHGHDEDWTLAGDLEQDRVGRGGEDNLGHC